MQDRLKMVDKLYDVSLLSFSKNNHIKALIYSTINVYHFIKLHQNSMEKYRPKLVLIHSVFLNDYTGSLINALNIDLRRHTKTIDIYIDVQQEVPIQQGVPNSIHQFPLLVLFVFWLYI